MILWLGLAALALAACGPSATVPPAPTGAQAAAPAGAQAAVAPPASPPALEPIRLSFAAHAASYAPFHIAMDKGYFAEEGLVVEPVNAGGGIATPALISGDVQYSSSAASALSAILKSAPLKVIYTNVDRPGYELWSTTPEVQTAADLVGKSVGILTRGDSSEIAVRMMLLQRRIDPNAIIFTALGGSAQTLAAAQAGLVTAVALGTAESVQLAGSLPRGHQLANLRREVRMVYMGLATTDRELQEHRERVSRVLRATARGRDYFRAFKDETLQVMGKYNDSPREANEVDYDDVYQSMTEDGSIPVDVQRQDAVVRAELNGVELAVPVEQMFDYSLVQAAYRDLRTSGRQPQQ